MKFDEPVPLETVVNPSDGSTLATGAAGYFDVDADGIVRNDRTLGTTVGVEVDDMVLGEHLYVAVHIGIVPPQRVSEGLDALGPVGHDGSHHVKSPVSEQRPDIGDALKGPNRFVGDAGSVDLLDGVVDRFVGSADGYPERLGVVLCAVLVQFVGISGHTRTPRF